MTYILSTPVTGGAQTGFTSPTYTLSGDTAPDVHGKQWAVTALGGTQSGVTAHTASSPFTVTFFKPKLWKPLGQVNPVTGQIKAVPRNVFKEVIRKAVTVLSGQPTHNAIFSRTFDLPAGSDTADAPNLRAAMSLQVGIATQQSATLGDTLVTGIVG